MLRRSGLSFIPLLLALALGGCVSTSAEEPDSGVEFAAAVAEVSPDPDAASPALAETHDGSVQVVWTSLNQIWRKVSTDGGVTFSPVDFEADGVTQKPVADFNPLGNVTAGLEQPHPLAAVVDTAGDMHLFVQVSDPLANATGTFDADVYYTRIRADGMPNIGPKALVVGGRTTEGAAINAVTAYDPRMRQWETVTRVPFDEPVLCNPPTTDTDGDTIPDSVDNCPLVSNLDQANSDADPYGDACDNCVWTYNPGQHDTDGDGIGNLCEVICVEHPSDPTPGDCDSDNDGVQDFYGPPSAPEGDNCPLTPNPNQFDADRDGLGDKCDSDVDHHGRWESATATLNGLVYKQGGENAAGLVDHLHFFNPADGFWYEDRPMPEMRAGHSLVEAQGFLYVLGGRTGTGMALGIRQFNPVRGDSYAWQPDGTALCTESALSPWTVAPVADLSVPRQNGAAVTVQRADGSVEIHMLGGRTSTGSGGIVPTVDAFRVDTAGNVSVIPGPPALPFPLAEHAAVAVGETIYVIGGTNNGQDLSAENVGTLLAPDWRALVWKYTVGSGAAAWTRVPPVTADPADVAPRPRQRHVAAVLNGKIYVMGGIGLPNPDTQTIDPIHWVDVFDPATGMWHTEPESSWTAAARDASVAVFDEESFPRNLSRQAGVASQIDATLDPVSGDLYVAWRNEYRVSSDPFQTNTLSNLYLMRSPDGGGTFLQPARVSGISGLDPLSNSQFRDPRIAIGPAGKVHMAWVVTGDPTQAGNSASADLIYAVCPKNATHPSGLACTPDQAATNPIDLYFPVNRVVIDGAAPAGMLASPALGVDAGGNAYVAWVNAAGTMPVQTGSANRVVVPGVYLARRPAGGDFAPPALLSTDMADRTEEFQELFPNQDIVPLLASLAGSVSNPALTIESGGGVDVLWSNGGEVRMRRSRDGFRFLDETGLAGGVRVGTERRHASMVQEPVSGNLVAIWHNLISTGAPATGGGTGDQNTGTVGQGTLASEISTVLLTPTP